MISFTNPGEIDLRLISTFGANVKEGDSPIGFFGTGLKYALAVLMRNGHEVTIWSGTKRMAVTCRREVIRGKEFQVVCSVDDDGHLTPLGFTTHLGTNWEMWMAYRELSCNTIDEKGSEMVGRADPAPGHTTIWVKGEAFEQAFAERDLIILRDEPAIRSKAMNIHRRTSEYMFYKGVRAMKLEHRSLYTYNCLEELTLTEDRTVKYEFMVPTRVAWCIATNCPDREIIESVLTAADNTFEGGLTYGSIPKPSEDFLQVVESLVQQKVTHLNKSALDLWSKRTGRPILPEIHELTKVQQKSLDRAIAFCKKIGYGVDRYPIYVVKSLGGRGLGLAVMANKTIFVAVKAFDLGGSKQVAATLIEEFVHLSMGYHDLTYEMQNYLFEKLVSIGEELVGDPL